MEDKPEGEAEGEAPPSGNQYGTFIEGEGATAQPVRMWNTGLCQFSCKQCICGICCMPCQAAAVGTRLKENCGCCVACVFLGALRATFRQRYGIKGSICADGYESIWCGPCVLWQLEREMDHLGI